MDRLSTYQRITGKNWYIGKLLLPIIKRWANAVDGALLDIGSGSSPFRCYFKKADLYVGIDRQKLSSVSVIADINKMPIAANSIDGVIISQVLGDVPDLSSFFNELGRVVKLGGVCMIFESTCYPEHDLPVDYYRIMPAGLEYWTKEYGFECIELHRLGGFFSRVAQVFNSVFMGHLCERFHLCIVARLLIATMNIFAYYLDRVLRIPKLCTDSIGLYKKTS